MSNVNIEMLSVMVGYLGPVAKELIFVGGCTVELHISDRGSSPVRAAKDIDCIIEAVSYSKYVDFGTKLTRLGFTNESDGPICRWNKEGLLLDIMPVNGDFLGFKSDWFKDAIENA